MLLVGLGATDLWAPDEPRFGAVAEEVRSFEHGASGLVLLHLNGEPYGQKPPLYYWIAAALGSVSGRVDEVAARLPSALAGVGLVSATWLFSRQLFAAPWAATWAALGLLAVYRFGHLARRAQLDVLLALFEIAALYAFWRVDRGSLSARAGAAIIHLALGLAVLTKGPVGLLPLAVMAGALAWDGRLRELRRVCPSWSWLLSLGPGLAWLGGALSLAPPGFFDEAVVENMAGRFFAGTSHARPLYYYLYQLPLDLLPLTLLAPLAFARARRGLADGGERAWPWRLLTVWLLLPLVFFSLSAGKRGLYLLPAYPAAALLCGAALDAALRARRLPPRGWTRALAALALVVTGAGAWLWAVGGEGTAPVPGFDLPRTLGAGAVAAMAAALVVHGVMRRRAADACAGRWRALAGATLTGVLGLELAVFTLAYPAFDAAKSARPLVAAAAELRGPGEPVGVFDQRPLIGAVAYYGGRPVVELPDEAALRVFLASGGRTVIARARDEDRVSAVAPFDVRARVREGRRQIIVATAGREATRAGGGPVGASR